MFDAFEQGSAARAEASGGLGLGLAISRGLVAGHGGAITASSAGRDRGATFTVRLLTIAAPVPVAAPAVAPAGASAERSGAGLDILLVEDHLDTAKVMARLLRNGGHTVRLAHSVAAAREIAREWSFDLLISDLGLPDGSGLDVVPRRPRPARQRRRTRHRPHRLRNRRRHPSHHGRRVHRPPDQADQLPNAAPNDRPRAGPFARRGGGGGGRGGGVGGERGRRVTLAAVVQGSRPCRPPNSFRPLPTCCRPRLRSSHASRSVPTPTWRRCSRPSPRAGRST